MPTEIKMELINTFRRNLAIKSYIKYLPKQLAKDYGKSKNYTSKQIKRTIERSGLSVTYSCYGIAMFSSREDFNQYHQEIGELCDYKIMRSEITNRHFNGNTNFETSDISSVSVHYGGEHIDIGHADAGDWDGGGHH